MTDEQVAEHREIALRLSTTLSPFWEMRAHYSEAGTFLERALARSEGASNSLRVKVLQAKASVMLWQSDYARTEALAQQSLSLYRELGDTRGIADCLGLLVDLAVRKGQMTEAITLAEERVKLMRQVGEPGQVADALSSLAEILNRRGEMTRVQPLYEEAQMLYRKVGNEFGVATTLIESATGLYWFSEGDTATIQTIRHRLQEGQGIVSKLGSRYWLGLNIHREIGAQWFVAWALHILGRVEAQRNELTAARSWYQQSLALTLEMGDKYITPYNLMGLARVLLAQGELTGAAQLWGAVEVLLEATAPLAPLDRADYKQAVATARAQLGEQAFAAAWAEGRAMTPEQASQVPYQTSSSEPVPEALHPHSPTSTNDLTAREMEVLRLLASGLTNAQIAETLVVSLLTVKAHLRSIYSKLGVNSRSNATRYALEHHLG